MRTMNKRMFLRAAATGLGAATWLGHAWAVDAGHAHRLGAAWRRPTGAPGSPTSAQDFIGVLQLDWDARRVDVVVEHPVPTRAHGLLAEPGGGFLVVAARPGTWLRRLDGQGRVVAHHTLANERPARTLDGHAMASADGQWLYTPETDQRSGEGWVNVRDIRTLQPVAQWPTHGRDPHQCVLDASGALLVANGGIRRTSDGKKRDLDQMDSSLVRLDGQTGERLGQWRLDDPRLSLRHLVWNGDTANPLLGVALQAEHDEPLRRAAAPVLAVWDGDRLHLPTHQPLAQGYAGDIAPGPGGGFALSGQRAGKGVLWHPDAPEQLFPVAELQEVCALASPQGTGRDGVLLGGQRGVARWHPRQPPAMLPWPSAMVPDNHWVLLS